MKLEVDENSGSDDESFDVNKTDKNLEVYVFKNTTEKGRTVFIV